MDNYTQIPNCLFNLLPYLTAAELKIILHIIRKTIGFHKETDRRSYSQFQKATGVHREGIGNAIISLKAKQLIDVTDNYEYSINWEVVRLTNQPDFAEIGDKFRIAEESGKPLAIPVGGMVNLAEQF